MEGACWETWKKWKLCLLQGASRPFISAGTFSIPLLPLDPTRQDLRSLLFFEPAILDEITRIKKMAQKLNIVRHTLCMKRISHGL